MTDRPARVVARLHPFRDELTEWDVRPGTLVARIIRGLKLVKGCMIVALKNGERILEENFGTTRLWDGELLNIRVVPANKNAANIAGQLTLGAGAAALLFLLNRSSSSETTATGNAIQNNSFSPPPDPRPEPPPAPIQGFGGPADAMLPQIVGISNRTNNFGVYNALFGRMRYAPFIVGNPYVLLEGNDQYLYVALCCGYGPLTLSEIKVGDKPIEELVTAGVCTYAVRNDTNLTIYTNDVDQLDVNQALTFFTWIDKRAGQEADKLAIDIQFPNGAYSVDAEDPDTHLVTLVGIHVEYRLAGSSGAWTGVAVPAAPFGNWVLGENTTQAIRRNLTWDVTRGLYDVRLRWHTATGVGAVSSPNWLTLRSIKNESPVRPIKDINGDTVEMVYLEMKIKASELTSGNLDNVTLIGERHLPSYNGTSWDAPAITRSPAWAYASMVTGAEFNSQLGVEILGEDELLEWHEFCELNGFTFDHIYDTPVTIQQALRDVCSAGRASQSAPDGKLFGLIDQERSVVVAMFNASNTSGFSGDIVYPIIPHALRVRFINPEADWTGDERVVYDDGYTESSAKQFEPFETVGVTDPTHAYKLGRYHLACMRLRPQRITVTVNQQHLVCHRGALVRLNYDVSFSGLNSGVITAVTLDGSSNMVSIQVDNHFAMLPSSSYGVQIRLADNTFMTRQVATVSGDNEVLTFSVAIPAATSPKPAVGDVVSFGLLGQEAIDCLIEAIEHNVADGSATVTLVDYSPAIYTADSGTIPAYNPQISYQHPGRIVITPPVVDAIRSDEAVLRRETDGSLTTGIQISLAPPNNLSVRYVQWRFQEVTETAWSTIFQGDANASGTVIFVSGVQDGHIYNLQVRYQDNAGRSSNWTPIDNHEVVGKTTPPPDVPELLRQNDLIYWRYDSTVDVTVPLDFAGFRVKFHFGQNTTWSTAVLIESLTAQTQVDLNRFPLGIVTVLVKAVDVADNESENSTFLVLNLGDFVASNIVVTEEEHPTFDGDKTNCAVDSAALKATDSGGIFWSGNDANPFWSGVDGNTFWTTSYNEMQYVFTYVPSYDVLEPFTIALDYDIAGEGYLIEYRTLGNSLFWNTTTGADANPFWTDDNANFWASAAPWTPWTGSIAGSNQQYEFRVTVFASSQIQGVIDQLSLIIDVEDIIEYLNDVVIGVGGTRLSLTRTYRVIDFVNLTLQGDAINHPDARTVEVDDKSISGPLIKAYDSTHTATTAKVDAIVQGH